MIDEFESMVENEILNKDQTSVLIVKIQNSILNLVNGNTIAAGNQFTAFINEVNEYVDNGIFTEEQGDKLVYDLTTLGIVSDRSLIDVRDGHVLLIVIYSSEI
jgi:hypothetical protein